MHHADAEAGVFSPFSKKTCRWLGQELMHTGDWCEMKTHRGWEYPSASGRMPLTAANLPDEGETS